MATWDKLQHKYAHVSEMGRLATQKSLEQFQHMETERAHDTISRFEFVVEKCTQQGVSMDDAFLERMILSTPNKRYLYLKKSYQHAKIGAKQDL